MSESSDIALVLLGGELGAGFDARRIPNPDFVVAADSGYRHAATLDLAVDELVGDLDSIDGDLLSQAERDGIAITKYPAAKGETDFELALAVLRSRTFRHILIIGAGPTGMRLDHFLGNVFALQHASLARQSITMLAGRTRISVVREHIELYGTPGETVSVLPLHSPTCTMTSSGLLWPLQDVHLHEGSLLGMSNQLTQSPAQITVRKGSLLVIQTGEQGPALPDSTNVSPKGAPRTYD